MTRVASTTKTKRPCRIKAAAAGAAGAAGTGMQRAVQQVEAARLHRLLIDPERFVFSCTTSPPPPHVVRLLEDFERK